MENSNILRNPSTIEIMNAIDRNQMDLLSKSLNFVDKDELIKFYPNSDIYVKDEVSKYFLGGNHPMMNVFCGTNFLEQEVEEKVNLLLNQVKNENIPFMWWAGALTKPKNLGEYLEKAGMIKDESPAMYLNLRELDETNYKKALNQSKIKIVKVSNPKEEEQWIDTFCTVFELDDFKDDFSRFCRIWFQYLDAFLVLLDEGKPVGVSLVSYSFGVAAIYNVGVIPEYRNRGIGTAITMAPLLQAKIKGYEISTLCSSELGFKVYSQIGYKECGKYKQYIYIPQPQ